MATAAAAATASELYSFLQPMLMAGAKTVGGAAVGAGVRSATDRLGRAGRRRAARANQGKGGGGKGRNAPASRGLNNPARVLEISGSQDRLILKGREFLVNLDGAAAPNSGRSVMRPINIKLRFLRAIALRYSAFKWKALAVHYQGNVSTASAGKVAIMPVYSSDLVSSGVLRPSYSEFCRTPGHKKCSVWDKVSMAFDVSKFSRSGGRYSMENGVDDSEANAPAHALYVIEGMSGASPGAGFLELSYEIELIGAAPVVTDSVSMMARVDTTDSSALGLNSATEIAGDVAISTIVPSAEGANLVSSILDSDKAFTLSETNRVVFNRPGNYKVSMYWTGTSPVPDYNGHTVNNALGQDVTASAFHADLYSTIADGDYGLVHAVIAAGEAYQTTYVAAAAGDSLLIDQLATGTVTSFLLEITEWSGRYAPYTTTT